MKQIAIFLFLLLIPGLAFANEVTIGAQADNTIFEEGELSNGAGDHLFAGATDDGKKRRALLRFDVAGSVPTGATIESVTLTMHVSRSRSQPTEIAAHRVVTAWGEGTSHAQAHEGQGAAATPGDATWTHAVWPDVVWSAPGADVAGGASSTATVQPTPGGVQWTGAGLLADVRAWLADPSSNHGWAMVGDETATQTVVRFDSRSNPLPAARPVLRVVFTPVGPSGACCRPDGSCGEVDDPAVGCPDYQGGGSECAATACTQPTGACCLPNAMATCEAVSEADCLGAGGTFAGPFSNCSDVACSPVLTPFVDPLPRPAVATPTSGAAGAEARYTMKMVELHQQLHRDLPPTRVWGFDDGTGGTFPGPTIEARSGEPVTVTWENDLRDDSGQLRQEHVLPVDTCLHGAHNQSPRLVVHLHGGHVPAEYDGYPERVIVPGERDVYEYPNLQQAAPLWYHDHALGITRLNVYMGLAGFYLVRDDVEQGLGLPSGDFEIPIVIQDRKFSADGQFAYPKRWTQHFFGDTILVNGKVWPFLSVTAGKYRFRLLNGSGSRTYTLELSDGSRFYVIGTDGGLMPEPVEVRDLTIMPGERYDIVIDFEPYAPGTEVLLRNRAPAPFPGPRGEGVVPDVMKFVVAPGAAHTGTLPASLRPVQPLVEADSVIQRDFVLDKAPDDCTGPKWLINGLGWDDITERPRLGTTEIWRFINRTGTSHPMHMHMVFFQVLDHQPFDIVDAEVVPTAEPLPPRPTERGWKDTVEVGPGQMVRVIARFEDYTGKFAYHCHILEHEDHEMMRQYETFTECGDGAVGWPAEQCDDGNLEDGDGCDSNCTFTACGNGVVAGEEHCDDANLTPGDGCENDCTATPRDVVEDMGVEADGGTTGDVKGGDCCRVAAGGGSTGWWLIAGLLAFATRGRLRGR